MERNELLCEAFFTMTCDNITRWYNIYVDNNVGVVDYSKDNIVKLIYDANQNGLTINLHMEVLKDYYLFYHKEYDTIDIVGLPDENDAFKDAFDWDGAILPILNENKNALDYVLEHTERIFTNAELEKIRPSVKCNVVIGFNNLDFNKFEDKAFINDLKILLKQYNGSLKSLSFDSTKASVLD